MAGVLIDQSRWTEIATRLRDAPNLTGAQMRLAKAIAILNLVSTTGVVRASKQLLAETEPHAGDLLPELEASGIVTYRDFSDEYRIWQGTDVDIPRLLASARTEMQQRSLVGVLSEIDDPKPVVAARHSAENDLLRVFTRRYVAGGDPVEPLDPFSDYDGEVLLVVGSGKLPDLAKSSGASKPVVAAIPQGCGCLGRGGARSSRREVRVGASGRRGRLGGPAGSQREVGSGPNASRPRDCSSVFDRSGAGGSC